MANIENITLKEIIEQSYGPENAAEIIREVNQALKNGKKGKELDSEIVHIFQKYQSNLETGRGTGIALGTAVGTAAGALIDTCA